MASFTAFTLVNVLRNSCSWIPVSDQEGEEISCWYRADRFIHSIMLRRWREQRGSLGLEAKVRRGQRLRGVVRVPSPWT